MEISPLFNVERVGGASTRRTRKLRSGLTRISPFMLVNVFLIFWLPFVMVTRIKTETTMQIVAFPFLIAYMLLADFALWNYFEGKKRWLIWMLEGILSAPIVYWFV